MNNHVGAMREVRNCHRHDLVADLCLETDRGRRQLGRDRSQVAGRETPDGAQVRDLQDKAGEFRVRFKYNSETLFSTEGYSSKASAQNAIDSIKKNGPDAEVEDNS